MTDELNVMIEDEQTLNAVLENESIGGGGTSDYQELTNKPKINDVELSGNKTTAELGIVIPDVSNFITKDVDDLTNYTKTSNLSNVATSGSYNDLSNTPEIPTIPANVSAFNNDVGYLTQHQDISGKQDTLVSGENIKTINGESVLGSGDLTISAGDNFVYMPLKMGALNSSGSEIQITDSEAVTQVKNIIDAVKANKKVLVYDTTTGQNNTVFTYVELNLNFGYQFQMCNNKSVADNEGYGVRSLKYQNVFLYLKYNSSLEKAYYRKTLNSTAYAYVLTTNNTSGSIFTPTANSQPVCKGYLDTIISQLIVKLTGLTEYSSSSTYNEGDYTLHDNLIYSCNQDNTTGAWSSSKWTQKTYIEYLNSVIGS